MATNNIRSGSYDGSVPSRPMTPFSKKQRKVSSSEIDVARDLSPEKRTSSALTVGDINADILAEIPYYPEKGGDGLAEKAEFHAGGSAANTAIVLTRFGINAILLGRVGTDPLGDHVFRELERAGVDLSLVQRDPSAITGTMFVAVMPDGERTMFGHRGANVNLSPVPLQKIKWSDLGWVHISGYALLKNPQRTTTLRVLKETKRRGMTVSLDVGTHAARQASDEVQKLLPQTNVFFQNLEEARALTGRAELGEALRALLKKGVETVALKLGREGCAVADGNEIFRAPAFSVDAVDSTGAGDSFDAGFILGRQWGLGLRASALLGNALGGLACTALGAGEHLPGPREARELIQRGLADPELKNWTRELELLLKTLKRFPET